MIVGAVALVCVVAIAVGFKSSRGSEPEPGSPPSAAMSTPISPTAEPTTSSPSPSSTDPSPSTTELPEYRSTGRFTRRQTGSPVRGQDSGQLMTYRVEVEQGSGVTSRQFAQTIDETLRHRRGWTAGGHWRFQRVVTAEPDLTIRLATPQTVDTACAAAGANTDGYTSCRAGQMIWLNLDRWYIGVPHVKDLTAYRHYLINHEVGHGLGLGHERCPGKGRLAPVMLQQTLGLDGCTPNAWPRTATGQEINGPPTR